MVTNVDDLFVLMLLLASGVGYHQLVVGYYMGILLLIILSWLGALAIPQHWIGWLGVFPVSLGVKELLERYGQNRKKEDKLLASKGWSGVGLVVGMTIVNGGDSLGVYIPLFAGINSHQLLFTLFVFLILTGIWSRLSYYFIHHPALARWISCYAQPIIPFLFIGLGIYILLNNQP